MTSALLHYPKFQAFDDDGNPLSGGKLYTYKAGTTTNKATYSDKNLTSANANPVVLDSRGEAQVYFAGQIKLVLKTSADAEVWTEDEIDGVIQHNNFYYCNAAETDQGAAGDGNSLKDLIDSIGTSKKATIVFPHSDTGNTTAFVMSTSVDLTSYPNIFLHFEPGALHTPDAGIKLTAYAPENILASQRQQIVDLTNNSDDPMVFAKPGVVSSGWYGTVADDSTESTTAIEAASAGGGADSTLEIPPGIYACGSQVDFDQARQKIMGYGATLHNGGSFTGGSFIQVGAVGVKVEGLKVDGDDNSLIGISGQAGAADGLIIRNMTFVNCTYSILGGHISDLLIEGCDISDGSLYGISIQNTVDTSADINIVVRNNKIDLSNQTAATSTNLCLLIRGTTTHITDNVTVHGNHFIQVTNPTNSTPMGVELRFVTNGKITNNFSKDGSMLCSVVGSKRCLVDGNISDNATFYGVEVGGTGGIATNNIVVSNNVISGGQILDKGIALQGTEANVAAVVTGNSVLGVSGSGVYIHSTWDDVQVIGNDIYLYTAGSTYGVYSISGCDRLIIADNKLRGGSQGDDAIRVIEGDYLSITGNVINGWTADGIRIVSNSSVDYVSITGNVFSSITGDEILTAGAGTFGNNILVEHNVAGQLKVETISTDAENLRVYNRTELDTTSGALAGTLGDGTYDGQIKIIEMTVDGGDYTLTVTNHITSPSEVFTFNDVGDYLILMWSGDDWVTIANNGVTT